jgi:hypothetical protein
MTTWSHLHAGPTSRHPRRPAQGVYIEVSHAPLNSRLHGSVAQGIEQRFPKPCVGSSILPGATHTPTHDIKFRLTWASIPLGINGLATVQRGCKPAMQSKRHESRYDAAGHE